MDEDVLDDSKGTYTMTPVITTLCEGRLTQVDVDLIVEHGVRVIRFRAAHFTHEEIESLKEMIEISSEHYCIKHDVEKWPIAIAIDIPNAMVRTGIFEKNADKKCCKVHENATIILTSDKKYWNRCNKKRIYVDDPFTLETIKVGTEISFGGDEVYMQCIEVINKTNIKCKVIQGGHLSEADLLYLRGLQYKRPFLQKKDLGRVDFAKDIEADIVVVNFVRNIEVIEQVRQLLLPRKPFVMASICDEVGIQIFDDIVKVSDGIMISRDILFGLLPNKLKLPAIEKHIAGKCKELGKPCFASGEIFNRTLSTGVVDVLEVLETTHTILDGLGLVLRTYGKPEYVIKAITEIHSACRFVQQSCEVDQEFWRNMLELKMPVNAADACLVAAALSVISSGARAVVVLSVTGKTAVRLSRLVPKVPVVVVTNKESVARYLLMYHGIVPMVFKKENMHVKWAQDMWSRVCSAVRLCLKFDILKFSQHYVLLRKSQMTSSYCDQVSVLSVDHSIIGEMEPCTDEVC